MKKLSSLILIMVFLLSVMPAGLFSITASAATSGYYTYTVSNGKVKITDFSKDASGAITIPSTLGGYPVTAIGNYAFSNCNSLTRITIPNSVTSIGNGAFSNCNSLTSITIPGSITSIGNDAFYNCDNLTSVTIPGSVTAIGNDAFRSCDNLKSVTISKGVTTIGEYAFYNCISLSSITIPNSVTTIGEYAFCYCANLTNLTIPDSVVTIGGHAFASCTSLSNINIPDSVTDIGDDVFYGCSTLQCNIYDNAQYLGNRNNPYVYLHKATSTYIYTCKIHKDTKFIGSRAFYDCGNLADITIPNNVTTIKGTAFWFCDSLTGICVDENNPNFSNDNYGVLFNKEKTTIIAAPGAINNYIIPGSVSTIGVYAFAYCHSLTGVTIPNCTISISTSAFSGCFALDDVWYMGSVEDKNNKLSIASDNTYLNSAAWHYDSCIGTEMHTYDDCFDANCNVCGKTRMTNHTYEWIIDQESNCTDLGIKHEECSVCHEKRNENTVIPTTSVHTFSNLLDVDCDICKQAFYQITFDSNGATDVSTTTILPGEMIEIVSDAPTRYGYVFVGWSTTKNGDAEYQAGNILVPSKSMIFYAQWDKECTRCDTNGMYTHNCYTCSGNGAISSDKSCTNCGGDGIEGSSEICQTCTNVFGFNVRPDYTCRSQGHNIWTTTVQCGTCKGTGKVSVSSTCTSCSGTGSKTERCTTCNGTKIVQRTYTNAPSAPIIESMSSNTITLQVIRNGEYSLDGVVWQDSPVFENLVSGVEYTFYQRYAKTDTTQRSASSAGLTVVAHSHAYDNACDAECNVCDEIRAVPDHSYTVNGNHTCDVCLYSKTPNAPVFESKTHNSITLAHTNGFEYSKDGVTWQTSNVFTNLSANTTYTFYQRVKASNVALVSATSAALTVKTNEEPVYTVTFKNWDGTVICTNTYYYGDAVTAPVEPSRVSSNTYAYSFSGWDSEVIACNGDATYTATYTPVYIDYTIVFKNWDGSVISTKTYHWGDTVTAPTNPTKAADNTYTYAFKSWDKAVINCAGNATYTATYTSTYIDYTVVFKNWDGTVLSTKTYHYGDTVTVPVNPARPSDDTYSYTFAGWDKTVVACNGDAVYVAVYNKITRVPSTVTSSTYTVSGTTISKISTGTTVSALLSKLNEGECVKVYNGSTEVAKDALIGTGMVVKIMDGNTAKATYTVVVTGDTSGDGNISIMDFVQIKSHLLNKDLLEGVYGQAADTNGDGNISIMDFVNIKAHLLGKSQVEPQSVSAKSTAESSYYANASSVSASTVQNDTSTCEQTSINLAYTHLYTTVPEKKKLVIV